MSKDSTKTDRLRAMREENARRVLADARGRDRASRPSDFCNECSGLGQAIDGAPCAACGGAGRVGPRPLGPGASDLNRRNHARKPGK